MVVLQELVNIADHNRMGANRDNKIVVLHSIVDRIDVVEGGQTVQITPASSREIPAHFTQNRQQMPCVSCLRTQLCEGMSLPEPV